MASNHSVPWPAFIIGAALLSVNPIFAEAQPAYQNDEAGDEDKTEENEPAAPPPEPVPQPALSSEISHPVRPGDSRANASTIDGDGRRPGDRDTGHAQGRAPALGGGAPRIPLGGLGGASSNVSGVKFPHPSIGTSPTASKTRLLGSWDVPRRRYGAAEYVICVCGAAKAVAQVVGKTCPPRSTLLGYHGEGPYGFLNNASTTCSPESDEENQTKYSPSTLKSGIRALHGPGVLPQAIKLRESGAVLSGPEAMELWYELLEYSKIVPDGKTHGLIVAEIGHITPTAMSVNARR